MGRIKSLFLNIMKSGGSEESATYEQPIYHMTTRVKRPAIDRTGVKSKQGVLNVIILMKYRFGSIKQLAGRV